MKKGKNMRCLFAISMALTIFSGFMSCSKEEIVEDVLGTRTDVAITGDVVKKGITYAKMDGYVNMNMITYYSGGGQLGIEVSGEESFVHSWRSATNELEGNKLSITVDTLSGETKYYYRTYVDINNIIYYGEKKSFSTSDFPNVTTTGNVSETSFSRAVIDYKADADLIEDHDNNIVVGIAYSKTREGLNPDSVILVHDCINYNSNNDCYKTPFDIYGILLDYSSKDDACKAYLRGLKPGTTYYYCSFTRAGRKYKFGDIKSFSTTALSSSQFSTGDATDVSFSKATITSTSTLSSLYPADTYFRYGVRYSLSKAAFEDPVIPDGYKYYGYYEDGDVYFNPDTYETLYINKTYRTVYSDLVGNTFTTQLTGLTSDTTYYYCAFVSVNGYEYLTGQVKSFKTQDISNYLSTDEATEIKATGALIKGKTTLPSLYAGLDYTPNIRYRLIYSTYRGGVEYPENGDYQWVTPSIEGDSLIVRLSNLKVNTQYYYRFRVIVDNEPSYLYGDIMSFTTNDIQTTGYVDLGLSCNWAACNLGASSPEMYGDYYAWGETEPRTYFYSGDYSYYNVNLGNSICGTEYDAATAKLGSPWRMPTSDELYELCNYCSWNYIYYKDVYGAMISGPNGNAIFIPSSGYKDGSYQYGGMYIWSGTANNNWYGEYYSAYSLDGGSWTTTMNRYYGMAIRPVR